jgi:hypothetical protein
MKCMEINNLQLQQNVDFYAGIVYNRFIIMIGVTYE